MEQVRVERLDHLGLIASVIKDLGLIASKYSIIPSQRTWQDHTASLSRRE